MCKIFIKLMLLSLTVTASIDAGEVDRICVAKVKAAAHDASLEAATRMNDIEFVFHRQTRETDLTHKQPEAAVRSDWNVSLLLAKKRWIIESRYFGQGNDAVGVTNENYRFAVARGNNDRQGRFKLAGASKNDDADSSNALRAKFESVQNILGASHAVHGLSWDQLLASPDYWIVEAKFIGAATTDDRPIRLEVQSLVENTKGFQYWVEFSPGPGNSLMTNRCGFKTPANIEYIKDVEYQPYGQNAFPKTIVTTMKLPQLTNVETLTIELPHNCTRSDAEFFLPYYGFSESVVDVTRTSSWVRMAAIILSLIGVAVSIFFYRLSRKPSTLKAAPV